MNIKYKLFPYPVLSYLTDDFVGSIFKADVTAEHAPNAVTIWNKLLLDNADILALINDDKAEYACHIECPQTSFREIYKSKLPEMDIQIRESKVNGTINVCTFVIAKTEIKSYRNAGFNPDYEGRGFHIDKGMILAYAEQSNITIDKEPEEFLKIPSIFAIIKKHTKGIEASEINLDSEKIMLKLCEEEYYAYQKITKRFDYLQASHAILIFPALVFAMDKIKTNGCEQYYEYRWFRAIKKKLREFNIELNDKNLANDDSYRLAQLLLNMPISRALAALSDQTQPEEGDAA